MLVSFQFKVEKYSHSKVEKNKPKMANKLVVINFKVF